MSTPEVVFEGFDRRHIVEHARAVGPMVTANAARLEQYFDGITERYESFPKAVLSIRRMIRNKHKTGLLILVDGKPSGVAAELSGQNVTHPRGRVEGINVSYWLASEEDDDNDDLHDVVASKLVRDAGFGSREDAIKHHVDEPSPIFATLSAEGVTERTDPSRGLLEHMDVFGEPAILTTTNNIEGIIIPDTEMVLAVASARNN